MSAADVLAVQQLAVAYADAVSRGDVHAAVHDTYAPDGRLELPTTEPAFGGDAVEAVVAASVADLEFLFQTVHLGLIRVDGDRATARFRSPNGHAKRATPGRSSSSGGTRTRRSVCRTGGGSPDVVSFP